MSATQIAYRLEDAQHARLAERARRCASTPTAQARADLLLLRDLLATEARRIELTVDEARVLAAITGGDLMSPGIGHILYGETADAFAIARRADPTGGDISSYATQFRIDEDHLLRRLAELGPAGDLAVRDALSRWWSTQVEPSGQDTTGDGEDADPGDGAGAADARDAASFAAAGLRITAPTAPRPGRTG